MIYSIKWFDVNKNGKVMVRKYEGLVEEVEGKYRFNYGNTTKNISKEDCVAWVLNNGGWVLA